jgi:hypothetical protein
MKVELRTVERPYSGEIKTFLANKYGDRVERIFNEPSVATV